MGKAPISFASRSSFDRSRPQMATRAPREINSRAVSNPMPELPPVTSAFADATFMCGFYFANDFCTLSAQGGVYARERDTGTSQTGQGGRKSSEHAGRRIRPRRDRAHPRGKAWSAIDQAGHRHRTVEG